MNNQELFDKVASHLLIQGKRSADKVGFCKYRFGKNKCAIGCLIPDHKYKKDLEGKSFQQPEWYQELCKVTNIDRKQIKLARDLQIIHDRVENYWGVSEWPKKLHQ